MSKKRIDILPLYTEKMAGLQEVLNQYAFRVSSTSNKIQIKKEIEERFEVKVKSVRTMNMPGKIRQQLTRAGRFHGRRPAWKKAIVTLEEGHQLDLFANA